MKCFSCPQPYHESTGHYYRELDVVICETCYKSFLEWMRGHVLRPWGGQLFYVEADTSIKPGDSLNPKGTTSFYRYERHQGPIQEIIRKKKKKPKPGIVQVVPVTNQPENLVRVVDLWRPVSL